MAPSLEAPVVTRAEGHHLPLRVAEGLAAAALAGILLFFGLPRVAGASWHDITRLVTSLTALQVGALTAVWLLGLSVHTLAIAAALPGLSHRRAFFLNITGSSVSNLLPLGGTAGTGVNFLACRAWGFGTVEFLRWVLVTNIWDVLSRLAIPGIALAWFAYADLGYSEALAGAAAGASGLLVALVILTIVLLRSDGGAKFAGRVLDSLARRLRRRPKNGGSYAVRTVALRRSMSSLVATAWGRLTVGKMLYAIAQAWLLWLCLDFLGEPPVLAIAFAAFAAERVLSLAVVTPGATGIVELGMTGFLVRMGTDPAHAAAAVLLYRTFVIGMEVPVGGAGLLWWFSRRLVSRPTGPEAEEPPTARQVAEPPTARQVAEPPTARQVAEPPTAASRVVGKRRLS
ncbi:MAG TPA: lysylphosphatidylglycerol synthase domain-containing protein [Dermatophilaceae bacterium]|nr:lysylphosphatidylglycerol synthase domain-containing protein [Dermatophilaceae bacterium]